LTKEDLVKRIVATILLFSTSATLATAADEAARAKRLEWWRDARFGMFIHWGLYAVPEGQWKGQPIAGLGEWIMNRAKIPVAEYELLTKQFNPVKFNAEEIVRIAKDAGMKYITITAKHHDGFAMFKSAASKYNIVDATPFRRDVLKELAAACQKGGLKLCFYYSQTQDWYEPDADGNTWDFPDESKKDFGKYLDAKVIPQVRELLTNYGPIGMIWFDTPRRITAEQSERLAALVHELQPQCLVNGRVGHDAGDYDSVGDNQISVGKIKREWETPVTMNDTWGFKRDDNHWKSPAVLIRQLAATSSRGGNYLLNIGPTALGEVPPPTIERLAEVGKWMRVNEESIRGTSAGPFPYDQPWGVMTQKPGRLYLHVFTWPGTELAFYGLKNKVTSARLLDGGTTLKFAQTKKGEVDTLSITLPAAAPDDRNTVIALDIDGAANVDPGVTQQPGGVVQLFSYLGDVRATGDSKLRLDTRGVTTGWTTSGGSIDWTFRVTRPGAFEVEVITSEQKEGRGWDSGQRVSVTSGGQTVAGEIANGGREINPANPYWPYVVSPIGRLNIPRAGEHRLSLKALEIPTGQRFGLTVVSVRLVPVK
jgi:alpha-L-fucosidase